MTGRIFLKLILGVFGLLLLALVTVDYFATQWPRTPTSRTWRGNWRTRRACWRSRCRRGPLDAERARAMAQAAGGRITLVRADGQVLVDSEANAAAMENHRTRPE